LVLGRYLEREFGIKNDYETLGRWMAHHLAEQLLCMENALCSEERKKSEKEAKATIWRIYEHIATQQRSAKQPRKKYKKLSSIIEEYRRLTDPQT
jgi:urease accessory protein UreF